MSTSYDAHHEGRRASSLWEYITKNVIVRQRTKELTVVYKTSDPFHIVCGYMAEWNGGPSVPYISASSENMKGWTRDQWLDALLVNPGTREIAETIQDAYRENQERTDAAPNTPA